MITDYIKENQLHAETLEEKAMLDYYLLQVLFKENYG